MIKKINAILSLVPNAEVTVRGNEVEWHEPSIASVTDAQIDAELARLQAEYEAKEYQRQRAAEYPDFKEYLDGIVKGDAAQVQAYIDACNAVKAKYPKGE
jgi:preprotein translocase subunit SecD